MSAPPKIGLSFDVEDWFCVRNMRDVLPVGEWSRCESRIRVGMDFILRELARRRRRATFFVLGWIAERFPEMVSEIAAEGHEIGSHGYGHHPVDTLSPVEFAHDLSRSIAVLSELTGRPVKGFRAPSFSITRRTWWALAELEKQGIQYDSSIFPVRHPDYGIPDFPASIRRLSPGPQSADGIIEVPMTSLSVGGLRVPVSGGGYFRAAPYAVTRTLLRTAMRRRPVVLYFHPWEFDPGQPRQRLPWFKQWRHYNGLAGNRAKFVRLLDDFPTTAIEDLIPTAVAAPIDRAAARC